MCLQELSSEASELSSEASELSSEAETLNLVSKISSDRMPIPSNEARRNLLPNEPIESFWDALWLELWPFLVI